MKVLSIGNSFSQDAHKWLHELAKCSGVSLETVNLYIGGCNLERHWNNILDDRADYLYEKNGGEGTQYCSVSEALDSDHWDIVTFQQASHDSGQPQTYIPYLEALAWYVRARKTQAILYFHQTWAYETDSTHEGFLRYDCNQKEMYRRLCDASEMASKLIEAPLIPVGTVIQRLRETVPAFDYAHGGLSLCRDGFHLSLDYGRFAAAATWLYSLTGELPVPEQFGRFDRALLRKILTVVKQVCDE